jgi:resuscitation-promoting factor RpfA
MLRVVTVAAGDTLWDIAAVQLGPVATSADIGAEWPRWFVANRQVIGDDPDLIYPGERLAPPP